MPKLMGSCHCKSIRLAFELPQPTNSYSPRACDCDFCLKHRASYISDPSGALTISVHDRANIHRYRQGSKTADFLLCRNCGVLVGITYQSGDEIFAAINSFVVDNSVPFGGATSVSPKTLTMDEKITRWKQIWFRNVSIEVKCGMAISIASSEANPNDEAADAVAALAIPPRQKPSNYPEPFASRMSHRIKRQLGDYFGIEKYGVNLTELAPGGESALLHRHSRQEEFIYILSGCPTLILGSKEILLSPGLCAGFTPQREAHQLVNRTQESVFYLEIGDRNPMDEVFYPKDDLIAVMGADDKWTFTRK